MVEIDVGSGRREMGYLPVVRAFFENFTPDESGVVRSKDMTLRWDAPVFNVVNIKLQFHSESIENDFKMRNPRSNRVNSSNFSKVGELGGKAGQAGELIEEVVKNASRTPGAYEFEFVKVSAASQGYEHLTDYEFEYEMILEEKVLTRADVDGAIR